MKYLRTLIVMLLLLALTSGISACKSKNTSDETSSQTDSNTQQTAEPTSNLPAEPRLLEGYDDAVIVASDNSTDEWKSKAAYICAGGELPNDLKVEIRKGNLVVKFAPGEYRIDGEGRHLYIGSNTKLVGAFKITQPEVLQEMLYPDPSYMAVFITTAELPSEEICDNTQFGLMKISGSRNVIVDSIALSGYTVFGIDNSRSIEVNNVLVHNYRGKYPDGEWCNMGYGRATGSLWVSGNTTNLKIYNCQVQCSSHHGLNFHSSSNKMIAKDIHIMGTRALYCGSGMLRGINEHDYEEAAARVPETGGFGYYDWSVAFDLCESQNVQNMLVEDCYALEGWKTGFYTEPEGTGGPVTNLKLIRCRSDYAGRRTEIPGSEPKAVKTKEGENANFFFQGGYFEDCLSVGGQKSGWYIHPNRKGANAEGGSLAKLVNCGDMGSVISLACEGGRSLHAEGFWSIDSEEEAIWLYGPTDFQFKDLIIRVKNQLSPPIILGRTQRLFFRYSRDYSNSLAVAPGGKYDKLRIHIIDSSITGTVYGLPESVSPAEIAGGSSFNGVSNPSAAGSGIELTRDNTTQLDVSNFVN